MKMRLKKYTALLLTSFALAACDNNDNAVAIDTNNTTEGNTTDGTDTTNDTDTATTSTIAAAYAGSWTTGCIPSPFQATPADTFYTYDLDLDATSWLLVKNGYLDESCTTQEQSSIDAVSAVRGTISIAGTHTDEGEVTTTDGLQARNLSMTVDTHTNTLDEPDAEVNSTIGTTFDGLVYVNDANVLFLDDTLLGITGESDNLVLTLPFNAVQSFPIDLQVQ